MDQTGRYQFSLMTALLLVPLAAGVLYVHIQPESTLFGLGILIDFLLGGLVTREVGFKLIVSDVATLRMIGAAAVLLGNTLLAVAAVGAVYWIKEGGGRVRYQAGNAAFTHI
jgi:hypothetical protein